MLEINTFSIAARCARTGMFGVAVSTAVPGVGGICPCIQPGVGAASTQSWVNPYLGIDGIALLADGASAQAALERLIADDPGRDVRQLGLVDKDGGSAAWSGKDCTPWFGHLTGPDYAVQGNMLVGERDDPGDGGGVRAGAGARAAGATPGRARGRPGGRRRQTRPAVGGDQGDVARGVPLRRPPGRRAPPPGRRAAARVRGRSPPVSAVHRRHATRGNPLGSLPDEVGAMLLTPPPYRPGGGGGSV